MGKKHKIGRRLRARAAMVRNEAGTDDAAATQGERGAEAAPYCRRYLLLFS